MNIGQPVAFGDLNKGAVYGSFFVDDGTQATTLTDASTYYPILGGMLIGSTKGTTFQNAQELLISVAGVYLINWSMSLTVDTAAQTIGGVVMGGASGTTVIAQTENASRIAANGVDASVSGSGIVTLAAGDLIRLGLENETAAGKVVTCTHANLTLIKL